MPYRFGTLSLNSNIHTSPVEKASEHADINGLMISNNDVVALEDETSRPSEKTIEALRRTSGDVLVLGAGGKMGLAISRMARRALDVIDPRRRVIAVSRFHDKTVRNAFADARVEVICGDLIDHDFLASVPSSENIVYLVGHKFGTSDSAGLTWSTNCSIPGAVCQRFRTSRFACLSTGNVYGLTAVRDSGGSVESDRLNPVGEYAMSCLGRERMFEYFSEALDLPVAILRLNYACELRYGVLVDLAQQVWNSQPISVAMGHFNAIWQADACAMVLLSLPHATVPAVPFNITGPEILSTRDVCLHLGNLMNKSVTFVGKEAATALLSDTQYSSRHLGTADTPIDEMIERTAAWISSGGPTWNKRTHFEVRDGAY